jgi:hypothetical protein
MQNEETLNFTDTEIREFKGDVAEDYAQFDPFWQVQISSFARLTFDLTRLEILAYEVQAQVLLLNRMRRHLLRRMFRHNG